MKNILITGMMVVASTILMASGVAEDKSGKNNPPALKKISYITKAEDASIIWTGSKVIGGTHTGTLSLKENSLEFYGTDLVGGSFTIDMNSMTNTDLSGNSVDKLLGHLKSDDFFGVSTYPTATFDITKVEKGMESGEYEVTGDLTIKSTTMPITFMVNTEWDGNKAIAMANIIVNRADFDVRYGSGRFFDDLGNRAIKDEFYMEVKIITEVLD